MLCNSCKKDNPPGAAFCRSCGQPLAGDVRTCPNGHNYANHLAECPYCPKGDHRKTQLESGGGDRETVLDAPAKSGTLIDNQPPRPSKPTGATPHTMIFEPREGAPAEVTARATRKLIGWLVTFDIQPQGTDFRLYEGRTRLGSDSSNDVVIKQSGVSDKHCLLLYREEKLWIDDEMSTNGTFVNGVSITEKAVLADGDKITVGKITLKLRFV